MLEHPFPPQSLPEWTEAYGSAQLILHSDKRGNRIDVAVLNADDIIGVTDDVLTDPKLSAGVIVEGNYLVLDDAGEYRYQPVGRDNFRAITVFERVRP